MKQCADFYNVSAEQLAEAVAQTNEYYGGYDMHSSRIVFPNGLIDPWHALGITRDIAPDLPAVFIKGEKAGKNIDIDCLHNKVSVLFRFVLSCRFEHFTCRPQCFENDL